MKPGRLLLNKWQKNLLMWKVRLVSRVRGLRKGKRRRRHLSKL